MKSLLRPTTLALATTFAVAALGTAHAQGEGSSATSERERHARHHHAMPGEQAMHRMMGHFSRMAHHAMDRLELSQEQRDELFELRHAAMPELRTARLEARTHRAALRELARAETFDHDAAEKASQAVADAQARSLLLRTKLQADMAAVLTPEQREEWKSWREKRGDKGRAGGRGMMP